MTSPTITFIGAGNMANSIIGGLIDQGYPAEAIIASDPNTETLSRLQECFSIRVESDNSKAVKGASIIVLAVKPQVLKSVCQNLQHSLSSDSLIISIAAGIDSDHIGQWLGHDMAIVRCMPNTPALLRQGASGLFATNNTTAEQRQQAEQLLSAVGYVTWLDDESLIDAVTAVSGSGPAYFFLLMEAMIEAGVNQGLSKQSATALTLQTALGAATLAKGSDVEVAELRRRVTSPGGTTASALASFADDNFTQSVDNAMKACAERSQAMAKEFS